MQKKMTTWQTKGMNRDMAVSVFSPEFSYENRNLRLATNEGNTTLSWVNEKGTSAITLSSLLDYNNSSISSKTLVGNPIGTAVLNHKLVIFTHDTLATNNKDNIYVLQKDLQTGNFRGKRLFNGNLNFNLSNPLETLVSYESDVIQKVYWTDGINQPRMINIAASQSKINRWNNAGTDLDYFFDFVPTYNMDDKVSITLLSSAGGTFAPGVIQYCFTYINKYGQQSNIVYLSTLYYLAHTDRGASPEDKVTSAFKIEAKNLDSNFDYIRLYSIQRTSYDDTPIVKLLEDIPLIGTTKNGVTTYNISYIDTGTTGSLLDPTELLFVGGKEITALTMAEKDNTLFLGNIKQKNTSMDSLQEYIDKERAKGWEDIDLSIEFENTDTSKQIQFNRSSNTYYYTNSLSKNLKSISTFKGGETYRFGFQLQKLNGEWTEPIFINDATNNIYPGASYNASYINLTYAKCNISKDTLEALSWSLGQDTGYISKTFKKIRPVVVYPTISDRSVLCQGVLNPTVFNIEDRVDGTPFAQASWFFRPNCTSIGTNSIISTENLNIEVTSSDSTVGASKQAITIDENFTGEEMTNCYVMTAWVSKERAASVASSTITYYYVDENYQRHYESAVTRGVVVLDSNSTKVQFAFLSPVVPFKKEVGTNKYKTYYFAGTQASGGYDLTDCKFSSGKFPLYAQLSTKDNYLYYSGPKDNYTFKFYIDDKDISETAVPDSTSCTEYSIVFTKTNPQGATVDTASKGSALRFAHYSSIWSDASASTNYDEIKQVEIQGSKNEYSTPYSSLKEDTQSNTQFFIDQSIVTLNSPDLEFDTMVQSYGTEGLKLRVVGAIPITSTASAHRIKASSAMLETNYYEDTTSNKYTSKSHRFGIGERNLNVICKNINLSSYKRLVSDYLWNDSIVEVTLEDNKTKVTTVNSLANYAIYPWQRTGPLNNDTRGSAEASSMLQYKRISNISFSSNTEYFTKRPESISSNNTTAYTVDFNNVSVQIPLTENAEVMNYRLPSQKTTNASVINYYPNIDKVLVNADGYNIKRSIYSDRAVGDNISSNPISMKYKSTTHAVIALNSEGSSIPILPCSKHKNSENQDFTVGEFSGATNNGNTFWGDTLSFSQEKVEFQNIFGGNKFGYLWIGELYKNVPNRFGGNDKAALLANKWIIAGDNITIPSVPSLDAMEDNDTAISLKWTEGDTFYQRYDCLKTYPFTEDDTNQIIEILSFMCETHVNIDGRYDRNRGQLDNTNMRPTNFNLINPVYSQKNNFFTSRKIDTENSKDMSYPNHIYFTKTKEGGADVDLWTNITLASILELDGDKGQITSLNRFNDQLFAFQDSGISQILYNEQVQIATSQGVPIEIANSGKVQGKRYITNTIGCSNKWAIANTPSGIYFIDSNDKSIYLFNGELNNLSLTKGFNSWSKKNIPSYASKWSPYPNISSGIASFYDKKNQEVLFINNDTALAYSEKFGCFTSFYDYGGTSYLCNFDDMGIWLKINSGNTRLYSHQTGYYNNFFGEYKPYSMTLIGNPEPQLDKIFTNLEMRTNTYTYTSGYDNTVSQSLPFESIETWNDYQHGKLTLNKASDIYSSLDRVHFNNSKGSLLRKFRMWRCDIPRDNAATTNDSDLGITRARAYPLNRMRNPWLYLKLSKTPTENTKVEFQDIAMTYFS